MESRSAYSIRDLLAAMLLLAIGLTWPTLLPIMVGLSIAWFGLDLFYAMVAAGVVAILQMSL